MMTILAMVNADKEGQIESKMIKARQMEEIREARMREAEKRDETKKERFEETKNALRKKRKKKSEAAELRVANGNESQSIKNGKRVSFA